MFFLFSTYKNPMILQRYPERKMTCMRHIAKKNEISKMTINSIHETDQITRYKREVQLARHAPAIIVGESIAPHKKLERGV